MVLPTATPYRTSDAEGVVPGVYVPAVALPAPKWAVLSTRAALGVWPSVFGSVCVPRLGRRPDSMPYITLPTGGKLRAAGTTVMPLLLLSMSDR